MTRFVSFRGRVLLHEICTTFLIVAKANQILHIIMQLQASCYKCNFICFSKLSPLKCDPHPEDNEHGNILRRKKYTYKNLKSTTFSSNYKKYVIDIINDKQITRLHLDKYQTWRSKA